MRIASPLIFDLARSVDVDRLLATERSLEVPAGLVPQIELPLAQLAAGQPFSVIEVQRTSFFAQNEIIRTNQAELTQNIVVLGQGLWAFSLQVWYKANFDAFTAGGNGMRVIIEDETGGGKNLVRMEPVIADPQVLAIAFRMLLPDDGWSFVHNVFTTGVGQTSHSKVSLQAAKLI